MPNFAGLIPFLPIISVVIGFISLLLAIILGMRASGDRQQAHAEYQRAQQLVIETQKLVKEFKGYLWTWEDVVMQVGDEISRATTSVRMAVDTLAYGCITVPRGFEKFRENLLKKAVGKDFELHIITFDPEAGERMDTEEFGGFPEDIRIANIQKGEAEHQKMINTLRDLGRPTKFASYFPVRLFIFDSKVAILVLEEGTGTGVTAFAYRTEDPRLVDLFETLFKRIERSFVHNEIPLLQQGGRAAPATPLSAAEGAKSTGEP